MRIRFKKGDPRAGMVAEVEGSVGLMHIASGAAEQVGSSTDGAPATPSDEQKAVLAAAVKPATAKRPRPAAKPAAKKAK